jgi:hypothetical protein
MSFSAWFPMASVEIVGNYTTFQHKGEDQPDRYRGFCPKCGTGRFFCSGKSFPETIAFGAGVFAEQNFPPPSAVLYWDNRPKWLSEVEGPVLFSQGDD